MSNQYNIRRDNPLSHLRHVRFLTRNYETYNGVIHDPFIISNVKTFWQLYSSLSRHLIMLPYNSNTEIAQYTKVWPFATISGIQLFSQWISFGLSHMTLVFCMITCSSRMMFCWHNEGMFPCITRRVLLSRDMTLYFYARNHSICDKNNKAMCDDVISPSENSTAHI